MSSLFRRGCSIERRANELRELVLADMGTLRSNLRDSVASSDEASADRIRLDLLACGEMLAGIASLMDRHEDEHPMETSAERIMAELSLARAALDFDLDD